MYYAPCGSMSYAKRKFALPKQVKAIDAIMQKFPNKRGVILPHSHAIRKTLVEGLKALGHEDRIVTHDGNAKGRQALDYFFKVRLGSDFNLCDTGIRFQANWPSGL